MLTLRHPQNFVPVRSSSASDCIKGRPSRRGPAARSWSAPAAANGRSHPRKMRSGAFIGQRPPPRTPRPGRERPGGRWSRAQASGKEASSEDKLTTGGRTSAGWVGNSGGAAAAPEGRFPRGFFKQSSPPGRTQGATFPAGDSCDAPTLGEPATAGPRSPRGRRRVSAPNPARRRRRWVPLAGSS